MTKEQIITLTKTLAGFGLPVDKDWIEGFKMYNQEYHDHLQVGCRPCYPKVLAYLIEKHLREKTISDL
jgi:hypothetical protein